MRISNNLMAINTHRQLGINNEMSAKAIEKLSSGFRINRAGDDAAGLAVSEKMRAQIRGLSQASRNSQDAISLIQTAEGATNEVHDILQRMRQLAVQAANDSNVEEDRGQLQNEVNQLTSEIDRIANNTEFNTVKLLNGTAGRSRVTQATIDTLSTALPAYLEDAMDAIESYFSINTPAGTRNLDIEYYFDDVSTTGASMGTSDAGASLTLRINLGQFTDSSGALIPQGSIDTLLAHEMMHGYEFMNMSFSTDGLTSSDENWFLEGLAMAIQGGSLFAETDRLVSLTNPFDGDYKSAYQAVKVLHEITNGGINAIIDSLEGGATLSGALLATTQDIAGTELAGATTGFVNFTTVSDFINWFNADTDGAIDTYLTNSLDFTQGSGVITDGGTKGSNSNLSLDATIPNDADATNATAAFNINFVNPDFSGSGGLLVMQVGANESQTFDLQMGNVTAQNLGVSNVVLTSQSSASTAITTINAAIQSVSDLRSLYGAYQNRLEHTIRNLDTSAENLQASESRIRDVDMAKEMMDFTKNNILQQASQAMLAQANQAPQGVLQLLR